MKSKKVNPKGPIFCADLIETYLIKRSWKLNAPLCFCELFSLYEEVYISFRLSLSK